MYFNKKYMKSRQVISVRIYKIIYLKYFSISTMNKKIDL